MNEYTELILLCLGILDVFLFAIYFVVGVLLPALAWFVKWILGE